MQRRGGEQRATGLNIVGSLRDRPALLKASASAKVPHHGRPLRWVDREERADRQQPPLQRHRAPVGAPNLCPNKMTWPPWRGASQSTQARTASRHASTRSGSVGSPEELPVPGRSKRRVASPCSPSRTARSRHTRPVLSASSPKGGHIKTAGPGAAPYMPKQSPKGVWITNGIMRPVRNGRRHSRSKR